MHPTGIGHTTACRFESFKFEILGIVIFVEQAQAAPLVLNGLNYSSCIPLMTMVVNVIYVFALHLRPLSISDSFAVLVKSPTSFILVAEPVPPWWTGRAET